MAWPSPERDKTETTTSPGVGLVALASSTSGSALKAWKTYGAFRSRDREAFRRKLNPTPEIRIVLPGRRDAAIRVAGIEQQSPHIEQRAEMVEVRSTRERQHDILRGRVHAPRAVASRGRRRFAAPCRWDRIRPGHRRRGSRLAQVRQHLREDDLEIHDLHHGGRGKLRQIDAGEAARHQRTTIPSSTIARPSGR